jgi:hypothetical protein
MFLSFTDGIFVRKTSRRYALGDDATTQEMLVLAAMVGLCTLESS